MNQSYTGTQPQHQTSSAAFETVPADTVEYAGGCGSQQGMAACSASMRMPWLEDISPS